MTQNVFFRVAWRYLIRHPWQTVLMVLGISLGVAVAVAVDLANASASTAFDISTETISGRATHQIVGGPNGLAEEIYIRLRRVGIGVSLAPVMVDYVSSPQLGGGLMQILGVDPFVEAPFRNYLGYQPGETGIVLGDLVAFLTKRGAVLLSSFTADRYGLEIGDRIDLEIGGRGAQAQIVGLLQPVDNLSRRALDNLILVDIATAQELLNRVGRLDRIDVILPDENSARLENTIAAMLPEGIQLLPVDARTGSIAEMTDAFNLNLTALSLLALVVGLFLIYNTMTFSVVQRRPMFGTLRALGMTRYEIFFLVMAEALLIGLIGTGIGLGFGVLLGQGVVRLVTRTINDLFFVLSVEGVQIPPGSLVKGVLLGVFATLLTAAPPAWEAATIPPRAAMSRSSLENKAKQAVNFTANIGLISLVLGGVVLLLPTRNLIVGFFGTFVIVTGFALLAPLSTVILARGIAPVMGSVWGVLGRMASRDVVKSLSRTSVAVAALMIAISVTIGVSLMVGSFRYTVQIWLEQVLQGDIYISAPSLISTQSSAPIDPEIVSRLKSNTQVKNVFTLRAVQVDSPMGPVHINASSNILVGEERIFQSLDVAKSEIKDSMLEGAVLVSEPFANRMNIAFPEASIDLYTDQGLMAFPVIGIFYDYTSTQGTVLMSQSIYHKYWDDRVLTAASLIVQPGMDVDALAQSLRDDLSTIQRLAIRPNQNLRAEVLEIFDRTFAITQALQLLATIVAFIGVLSALLSLELERQRELGILRAIGLTARQLWGLIMLETGMLGSVAGLLAMPTGYVLALILVFIINKRSFGWTLQLQVSPEPFFQALLLALAAALLAGIYPAWRMGRMVTAEAMRFES